MLRENVLTTAAARLARFPFWALARRPFVAPRRALILKPCCVSQAMLATPLLAALSDAYPQARFDWAISDWARPAVAANPRIRQLISTGPGDMALLDWSQLIRLVERLRQEDYDTCFIPSRSALLSLIAWWARIPQRIGLNISGRGFAHTLAVKPSTQAMHESAIYLELASAAGVEPDRIARAGTEFYPPDPDRTSVTRRLVDELDWLGDVPLVVMHPGGGQNPVRTQSQKQWPVARFVLLANQLIRRHGACIVLVGSESDKALADDISGLMPMPVGNWAGRVSLGEVGAVCEVANLFVGNDAGPIHIAAAVGCPTLAIFGPSNPAVSGPFTPKGEMIALWHETAATGSFSWDNGVSVAEAAAAADQLLAGNRSSGSVT